MKKRPKSKWRIIINGRRAEVVARWFGEAVRRAARALSRTVTTVRRLRCASGEYVDVAVPHLVPAKLLTDFETGGWQGVSGERIGPANLTTKS